ncbi:MAG: sigma-70 family RNA polymerase sigma factor [Clostridia bacterium]|nr:sigma-70 family RNA polymerase sigma factor [Clostridia bacterium]
MEDKDYKLFKEYKQTGDTKIRDQLVEKYLYIANILSKRFINRGIEYEDVFQVASLGILYAVERFDPDRGVVFATFATPTVLGEIRKYFRDKGNFIKIPRSLYEIFYKAELIKRSAEHNETSIHELARLLNISEKDLQKAYDVGDVGFIKSLEYEAFADGKMNFSNLIGREDSGFLMIEDKDFIRKSLLKLNDKELELIKRRYYDEETQSEIARIWGVSQMYVSRLERTTLKKLRDLYFRE